MPGKRNENKTYEDPVQKELEAIKRLLMLFLIKTGTTQEELALALQINQEDVSFMMPSRTIKKYKDK